MIASPPCPLCAWPEHGQEPCGDGPLLPLRTPLALRQWRHNAAAALRAASVHGPQDRACITRLLAGRGGRPGDGSLELDVDLAAVEQAVKHRDAVERGARRADGVVAMALARLVAGEFDRLVALELGPDEFTTCEMFCDGNGLAHRQHAVPSNPWAGLIDAPTPEDRYFFLAGGVGVDGRTGHRDPARLGALADELLEVAGVHRDDPNTEYVIVRRVTGWRVIDLLVRMLRHRVQPAGEIVLRRHQPGLPALVADWCATAPLRHGYELAVATIEPAGGALTVSTLPLFGAGVAIPLNGELRARVEVARPDGSAGPVLLPVLVATATPVGSRPLLVAGRAQLPNHGPMTVEVVLRRPGTVEFVPLRSPDPSDPDVPVTVSGLSWADVVGDFSAHLAFDVTLAIEVGGDDGVVAPRLDLARTMAHALQRHDSVAPGSVKLALIRYNEHPTRSDPRRQDQACRVHPFQSPGEALHTLGDWRRAVADNPYGAAVEEALHGAAALPWREGALRSLVVIGSRPPSVPSLGHTYGAHCPHKIDWQHELRTLRKSDVRCLAVVDEPSWATTPVYRAPVDRTKKAWQEIGGDGLFAPGIPVSTLVRTLVPGTSAAAPLAVPVGGAGGRG